MSRLAASWRACGLKLLGVAVSPKYITTAPRRGNLLICLHQGAPLPCSRCGWRAREGEGAPEISGREIFWALLSKSGFGTAAGLRNKRTSAISATPSCISRVCAWRWANPAERPPEWRKPAAVAPSPRDKERGGAGEDLRYPLPPATASLTSLFQWPVLRRLVAG
jgi:hypothetical protein